MESVIIIIIYKTKKKECHARDLNTQPYRHIFVSRKVYNKPLHHEGLHAYRKYTHHIPPFSALLAQC
jgi:hypothetical protein